MNEIECRAWDEKLKKFHYFKGIFNHRPYTEHSTFPQYESCPEYHKLIIELYIDLYDQTGEEKVYYNDLVKTTDGRIWRVGWQGYWKEWILCDPKNEGDYIGLPIKLGQLQAVKIGNIHEKMNEDVESAVIRN